MPFKSQWFGAPLAEESADDTELRPSAAYNVTFTLFVSLIHVWYAYTLHIVSLTVPKPRSKADGSTIDPGEEAEKRLESVGTQQKSLLEVDNERAHEFDALPFHKRYKALCQREWTAFQEQVSSLGLRNAVWAYLTLPTYRMHHFVESKLLSLERQSSRRREVSPQLRDSEQLTLSRELSRERTPASPAPFSLVSHVEGVDDMDVLLSGQWDPNVKLKPARQVSLFLRIWLLVGGILALTLNACLLFNMFLEFLMYCVVKLSSGGWLGFFFLFFVTQVFGFIIRRNFEAIVLMWRNTGDVYRIRAAFFWRFSLFNLNYLYATIEVAVSNRSAVTDQYYYQVVFRNLIVTGLLWAGIYIAACLCITVHTGYKVLREEEWEFRAFLPLEYVAYANMHWLDVMSAVRDTSQQTYRRFKQGVTIAVLFTAFVCFVATLATGVRVLGFVALIFICYWFVVTLRLFKWKALFVLWAGRSQTLTWCQHRKTCKAAAKKKSPEEKDDEDEKQALDPTNFDIFFYELPPGYIAGLYQKSEKSGVAELVERTQMRMATLRSTTVGMVRGWSTGIQSEKPSMFSSARQSIKGLFGSGVEDREQTDDDDDGDGIEKATMQVAATSSSDYESEEAAIVADNDKGEVLSTDIESIELAEIKDMEMRLGDITEEQKSEFPPIASAVSFVPPIEEDLAVDPRVSDKSSSLKLAPWLKRFVRKGQMEAVRLPWIEHWAKQQLSYKDVLGVSALRKRCDSCCGFFVLLLIALFYMAIGLLSQSGDSDTNKAETSLKAKYPVCNMHIEPGDWTIIDFIWATKVSYEMEADQINRIEHLFENWYGESVWNTTFDRGSLHYRENKPMFFSIDFLNSSRTLVSTRGTDDTASILQDLSIYSEVMILQLVSRILPLTNILPTDFIRDWVLFAAAPSKGLINPKFRRRFDKPIFDWVEEKWKQDNNRTFLLVGHSLGGSISQIVAAKMAKKHHLPQIYSFSLSSPGTAYVSQKFGFNKGALDKTALNLYSERDPFAKGDLHGGLVQVIECDAANAFTCHTFSRTFCELFFNCGGAAFRNLSVTECYCDEDEDDTSFALCNGLKNY